jgi:hypothetical protein
LLLQTQTRRAALRCSSHQTFATCPRAGAQDVGAVPASGAAARL